MHAWENIREEELESQVKLVLNWTKLWLNYQLYEKKQPNTRKDQDLEEQGRNYF